MHIFFLQQTAKCNQTILADKLDEIERRFLIDRKKDLLPWDKTKSSLVALWFAWGPLMQTQYFQQPAHGHPHLKFLLHFQE
jgi:hypothetical protein